MGEKYDWNMVLTKMLISNYENNPILFDTRHIDYKNRNKRVEVYKEIINKINSVQSGLDLKELKRKIGALRSQYLSEKMKIKMSRKSGSGAESVYTPTVYWFPLLKFLDPTTEGDTSITNLDEVFCSEETSSSSALNDASSKQYEKAKSQSANSAKRPKRSEELDSLLTKATTTMDHMSRLATTPEEDECDIFAKFIASELREIKATQSGHSHYRQAKNDIQRVLLNRWDNIGNDSLLRPNTRISFLSNDQYSRPNTSSTPTNLSNLSYDDLIVEEEYYE